MNKEIIKIGIVSKGRLLEKSEKISSFETSTLGEEISKIVEKNFKSTGLFNPLNTSGVLNTTGLMDGNNSRVIEVIDDLLTSKFQSFFGSVSQLGQRAKELNPSSKMVDAVKSGDLYNVLGEYIANKAGIGDISDIIQGQIRPEEGKNETNWKF